MRGCTPDRPRPWLQQNRPVGPRNAFRTWLPGSTAVRARCVWLTGVQGRASQANASMPRGRAIESELAIAVCLQLRGSCLQRGRPLMDKHGAASMAFFLSRGASCLWLLGGSGLPSLAHIANLTCQMGALPPAIFTTLARDTPNVGAGGSRKDGQGQQHGRSNLGNVRAVAGDNSHPGIKHDVRKVAVKRPSGSQPRRVWQHRWHWQPLHLQSLRWQHKPFPSHTIEEAVSDQGRSTGRSLL